VDILSSMLGSRYSIFDTRCSFLDAWYKIWRTHRVSSIEHPGSSIKHRVPSRWWDNFCL